MLCEFCKKASKIDKTIAQNNVFVEANLKQGAHMSVEGCILFIILHFCLDNQIVTGQVCHQGYLPG